MTELSSCAIAECNKPTILFKFLNHNLLDFKICIPLLTEVLSKNQRKEHVSNLLYLYHYMVTQRNLSANKFALNVGLFLDSTGSNNESTDAMHKNWSSTFFIRVIHTVFNKDDFHSIKEKRRSNATWLSTGHHMTTCICKQITSCPQIPITYNGASIYNPTNIDVYNINNRLIHKYYGTFDKSHSTQI
ncbi:unnamed protein product [Rhizophagus irregularis]|uniref:Uncharacterized protein n=1 Tax=Rhizophagus irregularis TaxID=588596 RepID=A0A916E2U0_9GLOM|nr:unnamed protein product [Rhizophagus irregularis]